MDNLSALVREMAEKHVWSAGVELARNGVFQEDANSSDSERVFRIMRGPRDPVNVVMLSESNEIWQCDCSLKEDPCRHVVASLIAVNQGKILPYLTSRGVANSAGVLHEFKRYGSALSFNRYVLFNEERVLVVGSLLQSLNVAARNGIKLAPTEFELRVDHILSKAHSGVLDPKTMRYLLGALSRVPVVSLDGKPVAVRGEALRVTVEIVDEASGFRLRRANPGQSFEFFDNGVALCSDTLYPVDDAVLRMEEISLIKGDGTFFPQHAAIELATRVLPQLADKVDLEIHTRLLPRVRTVKPSLIIEAISDESGSSATFIPRIVYGQPIIAEVRSGELVVFDKREVPVRDPVGEGVLSRSVALELGLSPERGKVFRGEEVIDFINRASVWPIIGDAVKRFAPLGELVASARVEGQELEISFDFQGPSKSIASLNVSEVISAWRKGSRYIQVDDGSWAKIPSAWLDQHSVALEKIITGKSTDQMAPSRVMNEVFEICESLEIEPPEYFKRLRSGLCNIQSIPDAELPTGLNAELRAYQRLGVNWITFLHHNGLGALLADDMGLGKTLQALCVVKGRTLVVAPTSVLEGWKQQSARFRPDLRVAVYHGPRRQIDPDADLIITSYAILRLDIALLEGLDWDLVLLDEAQTIRNPESQVAQAAFRIKGARRISLSGTPVENSLDDIWSQFRFLNPGLLGTYSDFQRRFVEPISDGSLKSSQELRRRVTPFILRRLKREVALELPPKTEVVLHCELSSEERVVYQALLGAARDELLNKLNLGGGVFSALEVLLRLRQACCHVGLLPGYTAESSSKVDLLMESLQASVAQGHRALVFSQWTSLLDRIEPHLERTGISFSRIDGSTEGRSEIVDTFQSSSGPSIMLLSLKAGGLGLNLTAADHVYIVDPWWNPAAEDQAGDRAYRIGQTNPVLVHRLVAKDTIEERILLIQQNKRALLTAAIGESGSLSLTREDMMNLLDF